MWPSGLTMVMNLTFNFQGQIWNKLYLNQNGPIATKGKAIISIELQASNVTMGLTSGMILTVELSRSNVILTIWWPGSGVRINR